MRQAIEEGFILDVLASYTTYKAYWRLWKTVEDDPRYDKRKAAYLLTSFVGLHSHAIEAKVRIMVDHFAGQVQSEIGGRAKAMIVTRSRLHAVRYKFAVDACLADPNVQIVDGKSVCVVSCRRSPEPVFLTWKGVRSEEGGDFFVRSGPGTLKLSPEDTKKYIRTRFPDAQPKGPGTESTRSSRPPD